MAPIASTKLWISISMMLLAVAVVSGLDLPPSWIDGQFIEAFVVAGTHDDVGWLKTPEAYYETEVRNILITTIEALQKDPARKFMYVEMYYFQRWWTDARTTEKQRNDLRALIKSGQWEFVEGGWVMPDEATTTFSAVADQLVEGHIFLNDTFGIKPSIGWQIDPFGASTSIAYLYHQAGFKYHVIDRINYKLKRQLIETQSLEFYWRTDIGDPQSPGMFTHILDDNYCMPLLLSFDFEGNPIINPPITQDNLKFRAQEYATLVRQRQAYYRNNKVLILHQCDFAYQNAHAQFDNMDQILAYINSHPEQFNMTIHWSGLEEYFNAVTTLKSNPQDWPHRGMEDFMPYDDNDVSWWTGYYTSRPGLKGLTREAEASLRFSDILSMPLYWANKMQDQISPNFAQILAKNENFGRLLGATGVSNPTSQLGQRTPQESNTAYTALRRALAIAQHHDAVAGTETQAVAENYSQLLRNGQALAEVQNKELLSQLAGGQLSFSENLSNLRNLVPGGPRQAILVFNSLLWVRSEVIKLPIWSTDDIQVFDDQGMEMKRISVLTNLAIHEAAISPATLFVEVLRIPAGGYRYIFVGRLASETSDKSDEISQNLDELRFAASLCSESSKFHEKACLSTPSLSGSSSIENEFFRLNVSSTTGLLDGVDVMPDYPSKSPVSMRLSQNLMAYESYAGWQQPSGAYIFHPVGEASALNPGGASTVVRKTPLVNEIYQSFTYYAVQTIRQYSGYHFAEVSNWIGPIPGNTEVISRWSTLDGHTHLPGQLGRDENGLPYETSKTQIFQPNHVLPIPANYYPAVYQLEMPLMSPNPSVQFAFDRSRGVSSQFNNSVEMMLHRRTLQDDWRGVNEALNDISIIRTLQRLSFGNENFDKEGRNKRNAFETNFPLKLFLANPSKIASDETAFNNLQTLYQPYSPFPTIQTSYQNVQISLFRIIGPRKALIHFTLFSAPLATSKHHINVYDWVPTQYVAQITRTSLTGLHTINNNAFANIRIGEIASFVIDFI